MYEKNYIFTHSGQNSNVELEIATIFIC